MLKRILVFVALTTSVMAQSGKPVKQVTDADIGVGQSVRWYADTVYVLNGFVYVDSTSTLTIDPGTVIKGKPGTGSSASALIVARGGKIYANGTAASPIIFTSESDDVNNPTDLPANARGLWGGVIILGSARINVAGGEENIEGIPTTEPRGMYGGNNDADNSGVFRYVSIRHGGSNIGANNEINGLTMGGVGSGTVIEFVEVFNNQDDGYEWFGGTVNTRYLISAFNGDDGFDYDEGWRGKNQFWLLIQGSDDAGSGGEHDGGTTPEDGTPYAIPVIYNATYIGSGATSTVSANDYALNLRDNAGGKYYNSIFTDFFGQAVKIEDLASGEDSYNRLQNGDMVFQNNLWYGFGAGTTPAQLFVSTNAATNTNVEAYFTNAANNNRFVDPMLRGISRTNNGGLDPRPQAGSPALTGAATPPSDGFFTPTNYLGAFKDINWAADWTFLSAAGYLVPTVTGVEHLDGAVPNELTLAQNFPNPFNPTTVIRFTLPTTEMVRLKVYDLLGREVASLVNDVLPAGRHQTTFDARGLSSGTYLYILEVGTLRKVQRMTLIK